LFSHTAKFFGSRTKLKALFFSVLRSEKLWNLPTKATRINCIWFWNQKHWILFSHAAESFDFVQPRSENFWN
jgi:hypothetical protein